MTSWLAAHRRACTGTLARLLRAPLASLFNIAVIGTALALPLGFYVILANLQELARDYSPQPQLSVFLAPEATAAEARALGERLKARSGVSASRFVPRAEALETLKSRTGLDDIIAGLPGNPLPDAWVITAAGADAATLDALRGEFQQWPKVAEVHVDSEWARRLDQLLALGRHAVLLLATALAFALVAVTFNTIRLQILTQRDEIEVAKLIGATDGWIRRPFLYFGAITGAAGGGAAWLMIWGVLALFNDRLQPLASLYGLPLRLTHLNGSDSITLLFFAAALGWFGAWLSVRRHLGAYNPS
ncbi:MAG: permease-like cell division protein FtsX [Burkholderiales bacterium]|nr:permease-like cell division protein FtsX [Burkholderiales bacterium]